MESLKTYKHLKPTSLNIESVPVPWRQVLAREVGKLKQRQDVLAVGLCGSISYGEPWPAADLDIEVVLRSGKDREIITTEQEVSVDYGYFAKHNIKEIPYETRPIYDPTGILTQELASRTISEVLDEALQSALKRAKDYQARAERALKQDHPCCAIGWTLQSSWPVAEAFTLLGGQMRTHRRVTSRLEKATKKLDRVDIFEKYTVVLGLQYSLPKSNELLEELRLGYHDIWNYFKGKSLGLVYMEQQPDSEDWFRNRIAPLHKYDPRDFVQLVYLEYMFVLSFIFRAMGYERTPDVFIGEAKKFEGSTLKWLGRYEKILAYIPTTEATHMLETGNSLVREAERMVVHSISKLSQSSID